MFYIGNAAVAKKTSLFKGSELIMWQEENILVMPDLFEAEERLILTSMGSPNSMGLPTNVGFETYFETRGSGWSHPTHLIRPMRREDAECVPHPHRFKIRQLVANVMVFILPDDLYASLRIPPKNSGFNEFALLDRIIREATLFASVKTKQSSESRLHGKLAAGFGGHVDEKDRTRSLDTTVMMAAMRELTEELKSADSAEMVDAFHAIINNAITPLGLINSSASEVESVHIGFINIVAFPASVGLEIAEKDNLHKALIPLERFKSLTVDNFQDVRTPYEFDNWTKMALDVPRNIYAGLIARSVAASSVVPKTTKQLTWNDR
jgi:predicted NUDIX family phosphoesterase